MKRLLSLMLLSQSFLVNGQDIPFILENKKEKTTVRWVDGLLWEQIKTKAKTENKYIFLDCYATWCKPCKQMDKDVYTKDSVGDFLNSNFISVKVQMDTSINDDETIKKWYADAATISREYNVNSYPSYLFLSPEGELVHNETGYKDTESFISMCVDALNPKRQYLKLLKNYKHGQKDYSNLPYLAMTARRLNQSEEARIISLDYINNYLAHLKKNKLYTKDNIQFIRNFTTRSTDKGFYLLYKNRNKISKVMRDIGYIESFTHNIISKEHIDHYLYLASALSWESPDWEKLKAEINKKFTTYYADRSIIDAKARWAAYKKDWDEFCRNTTMFLERYGSKMNDSQLSRYTWNIFQFSNKKVELDTALYWIKKVVNRNSDSLNILPNSMDTYANLLYKINYLFENKKINQEAIEIQQKALDMMVAAKIQNKIESFRNKIEKMKIGKPTW